MIKFALVLVNKGKYIDVFLEVNLKEDDFLKWIKRHETIKELKEIIKKDYPAYKYSHVEYKRIETINGKAKTFIGLK